MKYCDRDLDVDSRRRMVKVSAQRKSLCHTSSMSMIRSGGCPQAMMHHQARVGAIEPQNDVQCHPGIHRSWNRLYRRCNSELDLEPQKINASDLARPERRC